jgi:hypothetical protein
MNDFQKIMSEKILACYKTDELEKGGEGSKGGKVIGHTKSGKPIYDNSNNTAHHDFTREDHEDAKNLHDKLAGEHTSKSLTLGGEGHHTKAYKETQKGDHHRTQAVNHIEDGGLWRRKDGTVPKIKPHSEEW